MSCVECKKPRCLYSHTRLSSEVLSEVECIRESCLYTCGASLFPEDALIRSVVVRQPIVCGSPIEYQYYSSVLVHFPPVCYFCGIGEESLVNDDEIKELKKSYAVYPVCFLCKGDGKTPHCKMQTNVAKKRRVKVMSDCQDFLMIFICS